MVIALWITKYSSSVVLIAIVIFAFVFIRTVANILQCECCDSRYIVDNVLRTFIPPMTWELKKIKAVLQRDGAPCIRNDWIWSKEKILGKQSSSSENLVFYP